MFKKRSVLTSKNKNLEDQVALSARLFDMVREPEVTSVVLMVLMMLVAWASAEWIPEHQELIVHATRLVCGLVGLAFVKTTAPLWLLWVMLVVAIERVRRHVVKNWWPRTLPIDEETILPLDEDLSCTQVVLDFGSECTEEESMPVEVHRET